mmetsp:Transcript_38610/g.92226  ORF Transcript_38610/g.92226 Transcript_38610/m.92226 type:complete len:313 (+) Transcript_38610:377-1315(+)
MDALHFLLLVLVHNQLHVAHVLLPLGVQVPLEGLGAGMVHLHAVLAQRLLRLLLRISHTSIFEWSENGRGDICVVHLLGRPSEEPSAQQLASLDGHRGELRLALDDIANGKDVRDAGLVSIIHINLAALGVVGQTCGLQVQLPGAAGAANGHEHGIEDPVLRILHEDFYLAVIRLFELGRHHLSREIHPVLLHVGADHVRNVLIEASQQNGAHHDGHIKAKRRDETCALQSNVRGSHHQRLTGRLLLPEDVVRADAALLHPGHIAVGRPAPTGDEDVLGRDLFHRALAVLQGKRVRTREGGKCVVVLHGLGA